MNKMHHSLAFVFPGQGSQSIGMLKDMAQKTSVIQETFAQASAAVDMDLWQLVQQGPENLLNATQNTQPALLAASVALWRVYQAQKGWVQPHLMAGHSLGEYSALVCANAIDFQDAVKLVAKRGQLMQEAVAEGQGAMAAILGLEEEPLIAACQEAAQGDIVAPANFNSIGQIVIAGQTQAVARACEMAKAKGAKKAIPLPVSVPSHCELMRSAADLLAEQLENIRMIEPSIPVLHNVDITLSQHPDDIRERLTKQLYMPVRWVESVQFFAQMGIQLAVECGPGKVLAGLIKRIASEMKVYSIEQPADLELALQSIQLQPA